MKKRKKPWFYAVVMLAQPFVFALFLVAGAILDSRLWEGAESAQGHPVPVFTLLLPILGAAICIGVFFAALIGLIVCLRRRRKDPEEKPAGIDPSGRPRFCPRCGALGQGTFCAQCGERLK